MSPPQRLALIDEFADADNAGLLVSQIEVGGTGLNIQAASVVILTEPQWKPSTEEQAIARSHRLGQVRRVEVHRLLTENSVDEYMVSILADKSELFAAYARESALKAASASAVDSTELTRHLSLLPQNVQVDEIRCPGSNALREPIAFQSRTAGIRLGRSQRWSLLSDRSGMQRLLQGKPVSEVV